MLMSIVASPASEGWEESGRKAGVVVYTRARRGTRSLNETLAVGAVDAPPWVVKNAIDDYEAEDGPMPYLKEMRVVSRDERGAVIYHRTSPPLVADRDYTIRMSDDSYVRDDGSTVYVTRWRTANAEGPPPRAGIVRIERTEGRWTLEPIDGGKRSRASYEVFVDPGGRVPGAFVEWGTNTMMADVFKAIRVRVVNKKYWQAPPPRPAIRRSGGGR